MQYSALRKYMHLGPRSSGLLSLEKNGVSMGEKFLMQTGELMINIE